MNRGISGADLSHHLPLQYLEQETPGMELALHAKHSSSVLALLWATGTLKTRAQGGNDAAGCYSNVTRCSEPEVGWVDLDIMGTEK